MPSSRRSIPIGMPMMWRTSGSRTAPIKAAGGVAYLLMHRTLTAARPASMLSGISQRGYREIPEDRSRCCRERHVAPRGPGALPVALGGAARRSRRAPAPAPVARPGRAAGPPGAGRAWSTRSPPPPDSGSASRRARGGRRELRLAQRARRRRDRARPPRRPRRRLRDGRRRAARRPHAAARAGDRPGPARRLAPPARAVAAVPAARPRRADHGRLRAEAHRGAAPVRPADLDLSRHPRGRRGHAGAVRRGHHVLPARPAADGVRDLVVGPPLHLPRAVPVVLAPDRYRRVVRRPPGPRLWWTALWVGTLAVVVAARVLLPIWRSLRHRVRVVVGHARGSRRRLRAAPRPPARPAARRRRSVLPVALPAPRAVVAGTSLLALGGAVARRAAHHGQGPRRPQLRARRAAARHGAWRSRDPTGPSPPTRAEHDRLLLVGAGVGTAPILALLEELPGAGRRHRAAARAPPTPTSSCATRWPTRSPTGAAACSSSSARATRCPSTPAPCGGSRPRCPPP